MEIIDKAKCTDTALLNYFRGSLNAVWQTAVLCLLLFF